MSSETKILPLRYWDDPVLSTACEKIADNEFGPKLEEFGRELVATIRCGAGKSRPNVEIHQGSTQTLPKVVMR